MSNPNWRNPTHLIAAGFGSGLIPRTPGTAGSLAALIPWWPMHFLPDLTYWAMIVIASLFGIFVCGKTARDLRVHDHSAIVWDEFVGMWITLAWAPASPLAVGAGFVLFRIFDIWKPWPIRWCDKNVHGGFGIMFDDILAGIAALAVLQFGLHYFGSFL